MEVKGFRTGQRRVREKMVKKGVWIERKRVRSEFGEGEKREEEKEKKMKVKVFGRERFGGVKIEIKVER